MLDFIKEGLPDDPYDAAGVFIERYAAYTEIYVVRLEIYIAFRAYAASTELPFKFNNLTSNQSGNDKVMDSTIAVVRTLLSRKNESNQQESLEIHYNRLYSTGFFYEFTDGDLSEIQIIITDLRERIVNFAEFSDNHRERLLKKLETLQSELHKKMSSLDKFWGFMGEAGVVLGKFGNDVKPLTDRVQDLLQAAWRSQARSEELSSSAALPFVERTLEE